MHSSLRFHLSTGLLLVLAAVPAPADDGEKWDVNDPPGDEYEFELDVTEGTWMNLDVSPDGEQIVFDLLGDLYLLPIGGGDAEALTNGMAWDMMPRFSPDGSEIAFISDRTGGDNVWTIPADGGEPRQISREDFRLVNNPVWSPDGRFIAARKHFVSTRSLGSGEIWLYHASGEGSGLQLNEKPNEQKDLGEPAFSPDGRYVYFSQDTTPGGTFQYGKNAAEGIYSIRRIDRETGDIETVIAGPGGAVRPTPSPDGKHLAFVRRIRFQSHLFLHDLKSGENTPIYDALDRDMQEIWAVHGVYSTMAWTPDSRSIVFWAGGGLHRIDIETREVQSIPFRVRATHRMKRALAFDFEAAPETFRTRMLRWIQVSPAGDQVVFQSLGRLWTRSRNPETGEVGEPQRLTTQNDHFEFYPSWSRDGEWIVYTSWHDEDLGSVRIAPASGGEGRRLTPDPGFYLEPSFSPDGGTVVYRKSRSGGILSPLWSKDPGLYRIDANGESAPVRFSRSGSNPHFGADSERVYFTAPQRWDRQLLRSLPLMSAGEAEPRDHAGSKVATEMRVSPDGRWLAFAERFDAHVVPFTPASKAIEVGPSTPGLPVRNVSTDDGAYLHFSGEGSTLHWSLGPELFERRLDDAFAPEDDEDASGEGDATGEDGDEAEAPAAGLDLGFQVDAYRPDGTIAITNARLITMAGEDNMEIIRRGTVVVDGDRIAAVGPSRQVEVPAGATVIDASGLTVMPGLIDVHWHGPQGSQEVIPQQNSELYATLTFGVTTAHDPSTDTSTFFAASEMQRAGEIVGPRLFATGTILYGAFGSFRAIVETPDDAVQHLRRLQKVGAISVKSYNQPRRDQRQMIVAAAQDLGMLVVNEGGALFQHNMTMVADGHTGIEHSLSVGAIYDDVLQFWGSSRVGNTPTLGVAYGGIQGEDYWYEHTDVWANERLLNYVPQEVIDARSRRRQKAPEGEYNHILAAQVTNVLDQAGVPIMLGAHGQREGLAAHWELWMFEQGGMSPHRALIAGTINGARYIGMEADLGSLEAGKLADLIVLEENPLENLRSSELVRYVMVGGRIFDALSMNEIAGEKVQRKPFWFQR
ncbi:MAG: amidohydrolase family protein [Holophagales bacterium]|nr:amidohydrolase family protein [Holophagales bacterium]MYD22253.1 amidohydrolase family protein [Holophagales bacterium]MYI34207.1 amidohydrolase family protein [Holophagales bacterium]